MRRISIATNVHATPVTITPWWWNGVILALEGRPRRLGGGAAQLRQRSTSSLLDSFRLTVENYARVYQTLHATLAVVFQVRAGRCCSGSAKEPFAGDWSLPGGYLDPGETLEQSIRRHLAGKVDVRELSHLEQLETRSDPQRHRRSGSSRPRTSASFPWGSTPPSPGTRTGTRSTGCRRSRSTTRRSRRRARPLRAKLSYTNIGFALAPETFTLSEPGTSTRPRWAMTSRRRISSASSSAEASSRRPASAANPDGQVAGRPRSFASARRSSRSPISSPCSGRWTLRGRLSAPRSIVAVLDYPRPTSRLTGKPLRQGTRQM